MKARKPKKALLQVVVALFIALVVGVIAVGLVIFMVQGVVTVTEEEKKKVATEAEEKAEEVERLRRINKELQEKQVRQEVKALATIEPNSVITRSMVDLVEVPEATPGAVTDLSLVIGKRAINIIAEGETITYPKLASPEGLPRVPVGMRAITIKLDYIGGLDAKLIPGAYVDVLTTIETGDEVVTKTLIQRTQVISVMDQRNNKKSSSDEKAPWSVTLAVTPEQSELLTLANYEGTFHLVLRNSDDQEFAKVTGVDVAQLLSGNNPSELLKDLPNPFGKDPNQLTEVFISDPGNFATESLPGLSGPTKTGGGHTLEIYRGGTSEVKTFDGLGGP